jgi:hypothetical protein
MFRQRRNRLRRPLALIEWRGYRPGRDHPSVLAHPLALRTLRALLSLRTGNTLQALRTLSTSSALRSWITFWTAKILMRCPRLPAGGYCNYAFKSLEALELFAALVSSA